MENLLDLFGLIKSFYNLLMSLKSGGGANSSPCSVASCQGLHYLLSYVSPNTEGKYHVHSKYILVNADVNFNL